MSSLPGHAKNLNSDNKIVDNSRDNVIQTIDGDLQNEIPMNLLPAGKLRNLDFAKILILKILHEHNVVSASTLRCNSRCR